MSAQRQSDRSVVRTVETDEDVETFLSGIEHDVRRADAYVLVEMMSRATGQPPKLWGSSIVGFGRYHYVYATGREGDAAAVGFSPRKASTTVYLADGFEGYTDQLERLGPHTTSVSCLYLKRLEDVDLTVLEEMVRRSYQVTTTRTWP
ncbi:DUF1801 domain-containing protein [Actinotalea sp. K2]|uniref:DUF1801 domain-containing protein n=1 Tax=Actinotalea sp. K2 TaxID=2939438 RepID=UPI0020172FEB|nr:DUF1801 domain-containing protein [Actinotalea sp. K2]MCL3862207.1 DUF1801 domain-containing protein [Actinotalea sp. K2]